MSPLHFVLQLLKTKKYKKLHERLELIASFLALRKIFLFNIDNSKLCSMRICAGQQDGDGGTDVGYILENECELK